MRETGSEPGLQPIRMVAGWKMDWNTFMELDPSEGNMDALSGSSLLMVSNPCTGRMIDLSWRPEYDVKGRYLLEVWNFVERFDERTNSMELEVDWENAHLTFESRDRLEVVKELERLMVQLEAYKDPRILLKRGVIDEGSESLRIEMDHCGLSPGLIDRIIKDGNSKIQDLLIDHEQVGRQTLTRLADSGVKKGVRKKAMQKLNSRKFREGE